MASQYWLEIQSSKIPLLYVQYIQTRSTRAHSIQMELWGVARHRLPLGCPEWVSMGSLGGRFPSLVISIMEIMRVWVSEVETAGTPLPLHLGGWARHRGKAEGPSRDHTPAWIWTRAVKAGKSVTERKRNAHMHAYTSHTHHIHVYTHAHTSKPHTPLTHTHSYA